MPKSQQPGARYLSLALVGILASSTCSANPLATFKAGRSTETLMVGGVERTYNIRLPLAIEQPRAKLPVVFLLHGFSASGTAIESYSGFGKLADTEGFILVTPEGTGRPAGWNCDFITLGKAGMEDIRFMNELVDKVSATYPVDPKRIFAAGHSNGAMLANVWGANRPDKLAAIGCVAGVIGVGRTQRKYMADPKGKLSVLHIHGTEDRVVAYNEQGNALLFGPSAPDAVKWWAEKMGIKSAPVKQSSGAVQSIEFKSPGETVRLLSLTGWTHDWPVGSKSPIQAATTIWDFFKAHPKK